MADAGSNIFDRYHDYRAGVPLNAELAAVAEGHVSFLDETASPGTQPQPRNPEVAQRELTRSQRVSLRELRQHEGWPVLMLVLGKKLDGIRKNTISKSQQDPLKNRDGIAESWAYFTLAERFVESIDRIVEQELDALDREEQKK